MDELDSIMALARGEDLHQSFEDAVKPYEKESVKRLLKNWKKFAGKILESPHREIEEATPLDADVPKPWIRAYLAFRLKFATPRLGGRVTVQTLKKEFQQILRVICHNTGKTWLPRETAEMKRYIMDLSKAGASTATRPRAIAYAADADEIQFYLWNCCEREYAHPRMMVQFSFWLDIISVWGLRTGEVTESSSHRGSNEGVHYSDVTFSLVRRGCELVYQIKIMLRNRKFARNDESKIKTITLNEHMDPKERFRCPVRKFLALALADDVFVDSITPESLDSRWISSTAGSRIFAIKADKRSIPIIRKMMPNGQTSATQIWSAMSVNQMLGDICKEAGYTEPVTTYTFRRGVANKMEATASSKSTKEALGHKGDRTWFAYAAPIIGVDAQAIAYDKPEDTSYARYTQSIAVTRDFAAPKPSRSQMGISSVVFKDVLDTARSERSGSRSKNESTFRLARKLQHKRECAEYVARASSMTAPAKGESYSDVQECGKLEMTQPHQRPQPSLAFKQMLKYNPLQARVIETLWTAKDASFGECVEPLMALANPKPFRPFYPDPVLPPKKSGDCPYCHKDIFNSKLGHGHRATHLLLCHQNKHLVRFCLQCAMFIHPKLWDSHQCTDQTLCSKSYGVIIWRKLVIGEGRCPYGVGLSCEHRRWRDFKLLNHHVEATHLKKAPEGAQSCPAEGCGLLTQSKDDLRGHFQRAHRVHMVASSAIMSERVVLSDEI